MIKKWAKVDQSNGMIFREGEGPDPDNQLHAQLSEPGYDVFEDRPGHVSGVTHYWDYMAEAWEDRPEIPAFTNPYDLTQLPVGTIVYIADETNTHHEITDLSDTLMLEGPQTYRVLIKPPFPYRKVKTKMEVE